MIITKTIKRSQKPTKEQKRMVKEASKHRVYDPEIAGVKIKNPISLGEIRRRNKKRDTGYKTSGC